MKEPKRIPLSDNPRCKEPNRIPLTTYSEPIKDDLWEKHDIGNGPPPVFSKINEDNQHNNTSSVQKLESDETD